MVQEEKIVERTDSEGEDLRRKEVPTDFVSSNDLLGKTGREDPDKETTRLALQQRQAAEKEFEAKPGDLASASALLGTDGMPAATHKPPLSTDRGLPNPAAASPTMQNAFRSLLSRSSRNVNSVDTARANAPEASEPVENGTPPQPLEVGNPPVRQVVSDPVETSTPPQPLEVGNPPVRQVVSDPVEASKPAQPLEVGNPPVSAAVDDSNPTEVALGKIFDLSEAEKPAELVEYLKLLKDPNLLRIGIAEGLAACDPKNEHLLSLAQDRSPAGLLAMERALERGLNVRDIVQQRIKDGSLTEAIAKGEFAPARLLLPTDSDPKQLLKDLCAHTAGNTTKTLDLCTNVMSAGANDIRTHNFGPADAKTSQQQQTDKLRSLRIDACAEIMKQPTEVARKALFEMARNRNSIAADALETIISKDVHYAGDHSSRQAIPDAAILKFHEAMKKLSTENGLTPQELADHQTFKKDLKSLNQDVMSLIESKTQTATSTDRDMRHAIMMNEFLSDPKVARAGLADQPALLARYEKLLQNRPAELEHQAKIEKLKEALKPEISKLAEAAGLPKLAELTMATTHKLHGSYSGLGAMAVSENYSSKPALTSGQFADTVVHELAHLEQEVLHLRYTLQELGIGSKDTVSEAQCEKISSRYSEVWRTRLTPEFLEQVRQSQDSKPLTDAEKMRAERLIVSAAMDGRTEARMQWLNNRADAVQWFSAQTTGAKSMEELTKALNKEGFATMRARLEGLAGSEVDSKALLGNFDKLRTKMESGADFTSADFRDACRAFAKEATTTANKLSDVAHDMYQNKFHERDAFAAGTHADKLITSSIKASEVGNPANNPPAEQSSSSDVAIGKIFDLSEGGKPAELIEYLKLVKDPAVLRIAISEALSECDPKNEHLLLLAKDKSPAGLLALELSLERGMDVKDIVQQRINDGSLTEAIVKGEFIAGSLLVQPDADAKQILKDLLAPVAGDAKKTIDLCSNMMSTSVRDSITKGQHGADAKVAQQQAGKLLELKTGACAEILKQPPKLARKALFEMARGHNSMAADALETIISKEVHYAESHSSRRAIPDQAIREFHETMKTLAAKHGLTTQELTDHQNFSKELKALTTDVNALIRSKTDKATSADRQMRHAMLMNELFVDPKIAREGLANSPELLARYEKLLKMHPADQGIQLQLDKLEAALKPEISKLAEAAGLPKLNGLTLEAKANWHGSYGGLGEMNLSERYVSKDGLTSAHFVDTVVHELGHLEQDALQIRYTLEELGITKRDTPVTDKQLEDLSKRYAEVWQTRLTREFLNQIRAGEAFDKPLSDVERLRAERLIVSSAMNGRIDHKIQAVETRANAVNWFSEKSLVANSVEDLRKILSKEGFDGVRTRLQRLAGSEVDSKPLLESFDRLRAQIEGGAAITSRDFVVAHGEFVNEARRSARNLLDVSHKMYKDKFHEQDTYAAGEHAAKLVSGADTAPDIKDERTKKAAIECVANDLLIDVQKKGGPATAEGKALLALLDPQGKSTYDKVWTEMVRSLGKPQATEALAKAAQLVIDHKLDPAIAKEFSQFIAKDGSGIAKIAQLEETALNRIATAFAEANPTAHDFRRMGTRQQAAERSGFHGQRVLFLGMEKVLQPGNKMYDQGWRVLAAGDQSAADRASVDMLLVNVKDGRWLPLDVKQHSDNKTDFFKQYSMRGTDAICDKQLRTNDATIDSWLSEYFEKKGKDAFNASEMPPPDLKAQPDAAARRESLEKHKEALNEYLDKAQSEKSKLPFGSDEYERARDRVKAVNDMLDRNADAERFMDKENKIGLRASDSIRQFLEQNVDHFKGNNGASPTQPKDVEEPARRIVEDMVTVRDGKLQCKVPSTRNGQDPTTYHAGDLPALLNDAIDKLSVSAADKAAIRKNIGQYGLERSKAGSAQELAVIEQLEKVVREGLSASVEFSEATSERRRIVADLNKEQAAKTGEKSPVSIESIDRAARESDKALHKEVFKLDKKLGLMPAERGDISIGSMLTKYQEALSSKDAGRITAARQQLNQALESTNHLAKAQLEAIKGSPAGDKTELQRILANKKSTAVEKCLGSAKIIFDSTGIVQPGAPAVQYEVGGKFIEVADIIGCDNVKNELIMADQSRVALDKLRPVITVSGTTDSLTLSREILLGQVIAAHDVTLHDRASLGTSEKPAGMTPQQRRNSDAETMNSFRELLSETVKETFRTERNLLSKEVAAVWESNHKDVPFPTDPKTMTDNDRLEIQLAIEEAVKNLNKTALSPEQKSKITDLGRQWSQQEDHPDARDVNYIERTPHSQADDLLFRPSTTLSKAEADQFKKELAEFGPNRLAEKAVVEQFSRTLLEKTRQWTADAKPDFERQAKLGKEVQAADLKVQATALAEAQQKLGVSAPADAVKNYANKLIAGTEMTAKGSPLELAQKHFAEVRDTHAALSAKISQLAKARALELQVETNKFCREQGLPDIKINMVEHLHGARGSYEPGKGVVNIPRAELLDRAGGIRATNAIYHELTHAQQDQLVVRHLLDKANIKHGRPNDGVYTQLAKDYLQATGHELDRNFLKEVMQLRKPADATEPILLTETEHKKAKLLAEAFKAAQPFSAVDKTLANSERVSLAERAGLAAAPSANPAQELLKRLSDPTNKALTEHLFGSSNPNHWPDDVRRLVKSWEQAPKDSRGLNPNWDERSSSEILNQHLDNRVAEINQQRTQNHQKYISSFAEKEAHLHGTEVERTTRREYIDALHSAPERATSSTRGSGEVAPARERAAEAGIVLADKRNAQDFVDVLSKPLSNWRDDLTASWERGNGQRLEMRQAHDRALTLAREHVAASGIKGPGAEAEARRLVEAPSEQLLKNNSFREARDQYMRSRADYYKEHAPVHDALAQRQQLLQKELDGYCKDHGLPKVKLETREHGSSNAGYERGAGIIALDPTQLLDRTRSAELLGNLTKQIVHSQQDGRIVASIIDRSNGPDTSKGPKPGEALTAQQIEHIKAEYQKQTGSRLNDAFLESVRSQRTAVLTDTQIAHADTVAADFKASRPLVLDFENAQRDRTNVEAELIKLGGGVEQRSASHLLERLSAPGGEALCKQLFGVSSVNDLSIDHPARKLAAQYKDATVSGLRPAAETTSWSERKATIELAVVLSVRHEALREAQDRSASNYNSHSHALEADVVASDVQSESHSRSAELDRLRPHDNQGLDIKEAQERVSTSQNEHKFLDLLSGKVKELYPGTEARNLTADQVKAAMDHLAVELQIARTSGGKELYGVKLTVQEAEVIAKSGEALTSEFTKSGTVDGGTEAKASETRARVREHLAPEAARRQSNTELPYDPWPPARDLAALGEGRTVAETTDTGVRLSRERAGEEWSADKLPSEEQTKKYIEERIRELKNEIETKTKNGQHVTPEELAVLNATQKVHELLKTNPKAYEGMRPHIKAAFNRGRAAIGSATGVAIIVSAAIGFYIKSQQAGQRPPGLPALDLPGA